MKLTTLQATNKQLVGKMWMFDTPTSSPRKPTESENLFDNEIFQWDSVVHDVNTLTDVKRILESEHPKGIATTASQPISTCSNVPRWSKWDFRGKKDHETWQPPTFHHTDNELFIFDIDKIVLPNVTDYTDHNQWHDELQKILPPTLKDVTYLYKYSASAGISDSLNVHLYYIFNRGVNNEELKALYGDFTGKDELFDTASFTCSQLIFETNPLLLYETPDGVFVNIVRPCHSDAVVISGEYDVVTVPDIIPYTPKPDISHKHNIGDSRPAKVAKRTTPTTSNGTVTSTNDTLSLKHHNVLMARLEQLHDVVHDDLFQILTWLKHFEYTPDELLPHLTSAHHDISGKFENLWEQCTDLQQPHVINSRFIHYNVKPLSFIDELFPTNLPFDIIGVLNPKTKINIASSIELLPPRSKLTAIITTDFIRAFRLVKEKKCSSSVYVDSANKYDATEQSLLHGKHSKRAIHVNNVKTPIDSSYECFIDSISHLNNVTDHQIEYRFLKYFRAKIGIIDDYRKEVSGRINIQNHEQFQMAIDKRFAIELVRHNYNKFDGQVTPSLSEQINNDVRVEYSKIFSHENVIVCDNRAMKSGKTKQIKYFIKQHRKKQRTIVIIVNSIALADSMSKTLNVPSYRNYDAAVDGHIPPVLIASIQSLHNKTNGTFTANSTLIQRCLKKCDVVITDECTSVLESIKNGVGITHASDTFNEYFELFNTKRFNYILDADLNTEFCDVLRAHTSKLLIQLTDCYENKELPHLTITSKDDVIGQLFSAANSGEKCVIHCDTLGDVDEIMCIRNEIAKELKILTITSKTAKNHPFFTSPDSYIEAHPDIDIYILSPKISVGFSIETKVIDNVFCLFTSTSVSPKSLLQMISRVRSATSIVIGNNWKWSSPDDDATLFNKLEQLLTIDENIVLHKLEELILHSKAINPFDWVQSFYIMCKQKGYTITTSDTAADEKTYDVEKQKLQLQYDMIDAIDDSSEEYFQRNKHQQQLLGMDDIDNIATHCANFKNMPQVVNKCRFMLSYFKSDYEVDNNTEYSLNKDQNRFKIKRFDVLCRDAMRLLVDELPDMSLTLKDGFSGTFTTVQAHKLMLKLDDNVIFHKINNDLHHRASNTDETGLRHVFQYFECDTTLSGDVVIVGESNIFNKMMLLLSDSYLKLDSIFPAVNDTHEYKPHRMWSSDKLSERFYIRGNHIINSSQAVRFKRDEYSIRMNMRLLQNAMASKRPY